ncbi:MAG: hemerythrin domain-containing protein [Colwellia sp.]
MSSIPDFMTLKHRECDDILIQAENAVAEKDWDIADEKLQSFQEKLLSHLSVEENILFPKFEQATGMIAGPTQVMRLEHEQIRSLLDDLVAALKKQDKETFLGLSETLIVLIQQHNMKEEMMLYPMAQHSIADSSECLGELEKHHA